MTPDASGELTTPHETRGLGRYGAQSDLMGRLSSLRICDMVGYLVNVMACSFGTWLYKQGKEVSDGVQKLKLFARGREGT